MPTGSAHSTASDQYYERLQELARQEDAVAARATFDEMIQAGLDPQRRHYNRLLEALARTGDVAGVQRTIEEAQTAGVSTKSGHPTSFDSTMLVKALARAGRIEDALEAIQRRREEGVTLGVEAYISILNACADSEMGDVVVEVVEIMASDGLALDIAAARTCARALRAVPPFHRGYARVERALRDWSGLGAKPAKILTLRVEGWTPKEIAHAVNRSVRRAVAHNVLDEACRVIDYGADQGVYPTGKPFQTVLARLPAARAAALAMHVFEAMGASGHAPTPAYCARTLRLYADAGDAGGIAVALSAMSRAGCFVQDNQYALALRALLVAGDVPPAVALVGEMPVSAINYSARYVLAALQDFTTVEEMRPLLDVMSSVGGAGTSPLARSVQLCAELTIAPPEDGPRVLAAAVDAGVDPPHCVWKIMGPMLDVRLRSQLKHRALVNGFKREGKLHLGFCTEVLRDMARVGDLPAMQDVIRCMDEAGMERSRLQHDLLLATTLKKGSVAEIEGALRMVCAAGGSAALSLLEDAFDTIDDEHLVRELTLMEWKRAAAERGLNAERPVVVLSGWLRKHGSKDEADSLLGHPADLPLNDHGEAKSLIRQHFSAGDNEYAVDLLFQALEANVGWNPRELNDILKQAVEGSEPKLVAELLRRFARHVTLDDFHWGFGLAALAAKGAWREAEEVFAALGDAGLRPNEHHDGWMFTAYANAGLPDRARHHLREMQAAGRKINKFHDSAVLTSFADATQFERAREHLRDMRREGREINAYHFMRPVELAPSADEADAWRDLWLELGVQPDSKLYGALLDAYATHNAAQRAVAVFNAMREEGRVQPDGRHFSSVIRVLSQVKDTDRAEAMLAAAIDAGITPDSHHFAQLMRARRDDPRAIERLFMQMLEHAIRPASAKHWKLLASSYARSGHPTDEADRVFAAIRSAGWADADQYRGYLLVLASVGAGRRADAILNEMVDIGVQPTSEHSFLAMQAHAAQNADRSRTHMAPTAEPLAGEDDPTPSIAEFEKQLTAYADVGRADEIERVVLARVWSGEPLSTRCFEILVAALGKARRADAVRSAYEVFLQTGLATSPYLHAVHITAYIACDKPDAAEAVLDQLDVDLIESQRTLLYNQVIKGYADAQRLEDAERVRHRMDRENIPVDRYTLEQIVQARSRDGSLEDERRRPRSPEAGEWQNLGILVDDIVHELSQPTAALAASRDTLKLYLERGDMKGALEAFESLGAATRELGYRLSAYKALMQGRNRIEEFALWDAIEVACTAAKPQADRAEVSVDATNAVPHGAQLFLTGDRMHLQLAFRALILNAIQAIAGADEPVTDRRVSIDLIYTSSDGEDQAVVGVCDRGPGIPPEIRSRIFERGFTTKRGRGLGLGLSLVQSVSEAHGGSVTIVEESHEGTQFWLRLPARLERVGR